uniref:Transmembrane protein 192 n=1 Tax=Lutzomyia longipalpis TaxID=7200 RepID=A0A1B0CMU3_LUTLO
MDLEPVLGEENGNDNFRPLKTIPVFSFHLLVSALISIVGVGMAVVFPDNKRCEAYFLMLYLRVIFWFITLNSKKYFIITYFRINSQRETMDLEPVLGEENGNDNFRPLKTIPVFSFHLLVSALISIVGVGMAVVFPDNKRCEAYFLMLYLRVIFWFITLLFDHVIKYHHDKLRMNGFHDFHRATGVHKSVPLYLVSLWNTAIMAIQALMQHYYGDDFGEHCIQSFFSPIVYVSVFTAVECGILAIIHGTYIARLFDHVIKYHHDKLRMNGFHDFHRATGVHKSVPLYLVSLWNTAIMAIQALMQHYYGDDFGEHCIQSFFSPIVYVSVFTAVECGILAIIHGTYIARVMRFNRARPLPDAMRGSFEGCSSVGLTQRNADVAELLEKQADLISFLQDHNLRLNQRLMQMNSEVRTITLPPS